MTLPQHAAPVSGAARNHYDRVSKFEIEQAEADREKALEAARTTVPEAGPASICHTMVMNDGRMRMAAASVGGITIARSPMEMVGRPRPVTTIAYPLESSCGD